jgi:hypothetical protein
MTLESQPVEQAPRLFLSEAMASFEGTELAPLIGASLAEAGINPAGYEPKKHGHFEYRGFPATEADSDGYSDHTPSPIVTAIEKGIDSGEITMERMPEHSDVRIPAWSMYPRDESDPYAGNAWRTAKLTMLGGYKLTDTQTGNVLAYMPRLGSDGGRGGYAIISTNDVVPVAR